MRVRALLGVTASTVCVAIGVAAPASATTVDIPATRGCLIYSVGSGACGALGAGYYGSIDPPFEAQGLIQFDLSGIPANAEINSATLSLAKAYDPNDVAGLTGLREVAEPWDNHVTWLTGDGTNAWGSGNGAPYRNHGSNEPASVGPVWVDWDLSGFVFDWIDGSVPNYGLRLENYAGDSIVYFVDPNAPSNRPKLTIDYTA